MADIFVSYKRGSDEPQVEAIVGGLRANGYSVWWDRDIPAGAPWEETILDELHGAKLALVCWSREAVDSENVRSEARYAKERDKLVQVFVAPCQPPLFFGEHQGLKIEDVAEAYSPRFDALLAALRERLGAPAASPKTKRLDPAVRAWRRGEPRAAWEALQFGFTFSILVSLIVFGGLSLTGIRSWFDYSRLIGVSAIAVFLSGWFAYALVIRQPRRIGLFRGSIVALTAAVASAVCILFYDAVTRAIASDYEFSSGPSGFELIPGGDTPFGALAVLMLLLATAIARVWLPIFVQIMRPWLRATFPRLLVAGAALLAPTFMLLVAIAPGEDTIERRRSDHQFVSAISRRGLETLSEAQERSRDPLGRPSPSAVRRVMEMLHLPADGTDLSAAADALQSVGASGGYNHPFKSEWVLAADGSGDGLSMQEILSRSAGAITIRVRPGVYRAESDWSNPGPDAHEPIPFNYRTKWRDDAITDRSPAAEVVGPLQAAARAVSYSRTHRIVLIGEPGAVFEEMTSVTVPANMRIEGLVLRFNGQSGGLRLDYPSTIANSRIEFASGTGDAPVWILGAASAEEDGWGDIVRTQMSNVSIVMHGNADAGVHVAHNAIARILGTQVEGIRPDGDCIVLHGARDVTVRDNYLGACSTLHAVRAPAAHSNLILDNAGARDLPVLDRRLEQDFARY